MNNKQVEVKRKEIDFLVESNHIEGVFNLQHDAEAIEAWRWLKEHDRITKAVIKHTHFLLMKNQLDGDQAGQFRQVAVFVGMNTMSHASHIDLMIDAWLQNVNKKRRTYEQIIADHVEYEQIHPFIDGNGRTGRMFMNWQMLRNGLPILVIKESEKYSYYDWFKN